MALLSSAVWTSGRDRQISSDGWLCTESLFISTDSGATPVGGGGADVLIGKGGINAGIQIGNPPPPNVATPIIPITLYTAGGGDKIEGSSDSKAGIVVWGRQSLINTGAGADQISGTGGGNEGGIILSGADNALKTYDNDDATESDADTIVGTSNSASGYSYGIRVEFGAQLLTGYGDDAITGLGSWGIDLMGDGLISTSGGNDAIVSKGKLRLSADNYGGFGDPLVYGTSRLDLGEGDDSIKVTIPKGFEYGIVFESSTARCEINTGSGKDSIIADNMIIGDGRIDTGGGNDYLEAMRSSWSGNSPLTMGFAGKNFILGDGNDTVKGFGNAVFYGDNLDLFNNGTQDAIRLPSGTYKVSAIDNGYTIAGGSEVVMTAYNFELIGGYSGALSQLQVGLLTV